MSRETENDRIPPQSLTVIIVMFVVELNFLRAPRPVSLAAGQDAWLALIVASAVMTLAVVLLVMVMRRFPTMTLVEIARTVFGPFLGTIIVAFFLFFWLGRAGTLLLIHSHLFATQLLPFTPEIALSLYMLLLSAYLVRHGIEPMVRLYLVLLGAAFFPLIPILLLGLGGAEWGRLKPVLADGVLPVLRGAWVAYGASVGPTIILMTGPMLAHWRGVLPAALTGVLLVAIPALSLTLLLHAHFGTQGVAEHTWPTLALLEVIEVPGFNGLRLDPVFLTVWSLLVFGTITLAHYASAAIVRRFFRLETNFWPVWITTILIGLMAALPVNPQQLLSIMEKFTPYAVPAITLVFPGVTLLVSHFRGIGEKGGVDGGTLASKKP